MPIVENQRLDRMESAGTAERSAAGEATAVLLGRAKLLPPAERLMLELSLQRRLSFRQIGQLTNLPSGTVSRRLRRIKEKLQDPVAVAVCDPACRLEPALRELAIGHFLHDVPVRDLARAHGMSVHVALQKVGYIRGWVRGRRDGWLARGRIEER